MTINVERVTQAILASSASSLAVEEGAALVEHWLGANLCLDKTIVAVECGFVNWLDDLTVVIGVQDLLTHEDGAVVGNEWKTTKEKTRYWNETAWLESIANGSQLKIYALALQSGTYYESGTGRTIQPRVVAPRIRVRAISKSSPPVIWPTSGDADGMLTFTQSTLDLTRDALLAKASTIRAMRRTGLVPWQLPGIWCTNQFRKTCIYHQECLDGKVPPNEAGKFDSDDPASQLALQYVGDRLNDPDVVVLGASAYSAMSECAEKWRRDILGGNGEESLALSTGTVLHAGIAEVYRQMRESQTETPKTLDIRV